MRFRIDWFLFTHSRNGIYVGDRVSLVGYAKEESEWNGGARCINYVGAMFEVRVS